MVGEYKIFELCVSYLIPCILFKMSAKAIREYDGKIILCKYFNKLSRDTDPSAERVNADTKALQVKLDTDIETASSTAPWISTQVYQCLYVYTCLLLQAIQRLVRL